MNMEDQRILVIDVGNTQMVFGLYKAEQLLTHWRLSSERRFTPDELAWQLYGMFEQSGQPAKRSPALLPPVSCRTWTSCSVWHVSASAA